MNKNPAALIRKILFLVIDMLVCLTRILILCDS